MIETAVTEMKVVKTVDGESSTDSYGYNYIVYQPYRVWQLDLAGQTLFFKQSGVMDSYGETVAWASAMIEVEPTVKTITTYDLDKM